MTVEKDPSIKAAQSRAARLRLQAARTQLTAALTYCSTAENALVLGQAEKGRQAIQKARHTAETVHAHIEEPNHLPADSVAIMRDHLGELRRKISNIEARFPS